MPPTGPDRPDPSDALPAPALPPEALADPRRLASVLAAVLDQQNREAAAHRAQARELIRAVDGLAKAHEFLGTELREERRRARSLLAALVVVPLAVLAAGAVVVLSARDTDARLDDLRATVSADLRELRARPAVDPEAARRAEEQRQEAEARLAAATTDAQALRGDLDAARTALADERAAAEARERETAARFADAERDRIELAGLRAALKSAGDVAGAEKARADEMARRLAELEARAAAPAAASPSAAERRPVEAPTTSAPGPVPSRPPAASVPPAASAPPAAAADRSRASTSGADLERVTSTLNRLLEGTTGAARYDVEAVAGLSGTELLGVRVVGRDAQGTTLRTVEAERLEITVADAGGVRLRFADGHLVVGGRRAPFFDGAYTIALDGPAQPWRDSGLTCLRFR